MPTSQSLVPSLVGAFLDHYPREAASCVEGLTVPETLEFSKDVRPSQIVSLLPFLPAERTRILIESMSNELFGDVMLQLKPSVAAAFLSLYEPTLLEKRLDQLPAQSAKELRELTRYPEDSAGRLMDRTFFAFRRDTSVSQALQLLRKHSDRKIYDIIVSNDQGQFFGTIPLQVLAVAQLKERLDQLPKRRVECINVFSPREEIAEIFETSKVTTLPVVNVENYVVGVIRHDELVATAQDDAASDLLTMVGASPEERALSTSFTAVKKRLPWLGINLLTAFLASAVVGLFEGTIAKITALAVLLPVVAGQSGNTGAQAMAVTMRGLALREIRVRHWIKLMWKELGAGFLNGSAVAIMTSVGVFVWSRNLGLSFVIGTAMVVSMIIASISGATVPVVLTAMGKDPAQSSSIILTTVTDVMGFLSFLGLATLFAGWLV